MDTVNIAPINTQSFVWAQDVTGWAYDYPLGAGVWRAQMRLAADSPVAVYEWSTANGGILYTKASAVGSIAFTANPTNGTFVNIGTSSVEFVTSGATGLQVNIAGSLAASLAALLAALRASTDPQLLSCQYILTGTTLGVQASKGGISGNNIALGTSVNGATASGATLTGGAHTVVLVSPISLTEGFLGPYVYDCRFEYDGQFIPIFGGTMTWTQGVTRLTSDSDTSIAFVPSAGYVCSQPSLYNLLYWAT